MFNRLFQATEEPAFAGAARRWLGLDLAYRRPGAGVGGFRAVQPGPVGDPVWHPIPGFPYGAAGMGLALLATAAPIEPSWDLLLLLTYGVCLASWPGRSPATPPGRSLAICAASRKAGR